MIILNKRKFRVLWRRVFGHKHCLCDVHLKDGKVFYDIDTHLWSKHNFGFIQHYREVNDSRTRLKFYPPNRIITRIVFQCSSCDRQTTCDKSFRGRNRREEA